MGANGAKVPPPQLGSHLVPVATVAPHPIAPDATLAPLAPVVLFSFHMTAFNSQIGENSPACDVLRFCQAGDSIAKDQAASSSRPTMPRYEVPSSSAGVVKTCQCSSWARISTSARQSHG